MKRFWIDELLNIQYLVSLMKEVLDDIYDWMMWVLVTYYPMAG